MGTQQLQKVDKHSFYYIPNYPLICLIVASLLLSQVVEVRRAGQPSFPIHPVKPSIDRLPSCPCPCLCFKLVFTNSKFIFHVNLVRLAHIAFICLNYLPIQKLVDHL